MGDSPADVLSLPDPDGRTSGVPHLGCNYLAELAADNTWSCAHCGTSGPAGQAVKPPSDEDWLVPPAAVVEAVERALLGYLAPFRLPRGEVHNAAVVAARAALHPGADG